MGSHVVTFALWLHIIKYMRSELAASRSPFRQPVSLRMDIRLDKLAAPARTEALCWKHFSNDLGPMINFSVSGDAGATDAKSKLAILMSSISYSTYWKCAGHAAAQATAGCLRQNSAAKEVWTRTHAHVLEGIGANPMKFIHTMYI